jgi:exodeoxyribonuclease VII small subunit
VPAPATDDTGQFGLILPDAEASPNPQSRLKYRALFPPGLDFMAKSRAATPPKDYESALAEIEAIVAEMESGQLPLDASLAAYKRGAELLNYCRQQLADAEQQVKILENGTLQNFKPDSSAQTASADD